MDGMDESADRGARQRLLASRWTGGIRLLIRRFRSGFESRGAHLGRAAKLLVEALKASCAAATLLVHMIRCGSVYPRVYVRTRFMMDTVAPVAG